jgi:Polyketide cyclase / dehydrase and lipid transport
MASIYRDLDVDVSAERAWGELRRVGEPDKLFAPVLIGAQLNGDTRTVRFANGMIAQERILDVDDNRRRVAYTVLDGPGMTFHHASMQIVDAGPDRCRFVWITDFLPQEIGDSIMPLIEQGASALKSNLERRYSPARA